MTHKTFVTLVIVGLLFCPAGYALAQESTSSETGVVDGGQAGMGTPEVTTVNDAAPDVPAEQNTRFRWGVSGAGGPLLAGYSGGVGGFDARFGAQINPTIAVYAQPIMLLGAGATASATGGSLTGLALFGAALLADATFLDLLYVAAGPELLAGAVAEGSVSTTTMNEDTSAGVGTFFSIAARAGVALGPKRPDRRKGFTIGLDMHVVFGPEVAVIPLLALGFEAF